MKVYSVDEDFAFFMASAALRDVAITYPIQGVEMELAAFILNPTDANPEYLLDLVLFPPGSRACPLYVGGRIVLWEIIDHYGRLQPTALYTIAHVAEVFT